MSERAPDGTAYDLTGPKDAPHLVLIHGLGLSRHLWQPFGTDFSAYRVLQYDLYGHGDSPPAPRKADLRLFSDQIAGLMDHIGADTATLIGFSIGGMINRRFALDHAHRLDRLVILNSPHDRGDEAQKLVEDRAAKVREQGPDATLPNALKRWFTESYLFTGAGVEQVREWRFRVDPDSYAQTAWVLANGVRELIAPEPAITAPSLVMTCEKDSGSTPAMSASIAAEIPGAEIQIIPFLQHLGLIEAHEAFATPILDFLKRTDP